MVEVVAIVPNYRLPQDTLQVLADLAGSGLRGLHTILIDDGSGDDSARRFDAAVAGRTDAEAIALPTNLGYCRAVNRGIARARELGARYVLMLNNDVRFEGTSLAPLVDCLDHDPSLAAVGPTIVTPDGRAWSQGGAVRARPNLVTLHNQGGEPAPLDHGPEAVEFLPGACALYRLDDLAAVGDLDEDYFMYWEDVELGAQLRARGRQLLWLPWLRVVHEVSRSSGGGRSPLRKYLSARNTVRYLRRHGRVRDWVVFWLVDVMLFPLTFLSGTPPRAAFAKARGLRDGLLDRPIPSVSRASN